MLKTIIAALVGAAAVPAMAAAPAPIEVMVLGSYHFDNPGRDLNNVKVASVLTIKRQAELAAVAKAILTWHPTRVVVEYESDAPDLSVPAFASFTPADLATKPDERVQIAYRIAHLAGVPVNGIDEQNKTDEPDYFPYDKLQDVAAKTGQGARLEAAMAPIAAWSKAFEASQPTRTVAQLLTEMNDPTEPVANNGPDLRHPRRRRPRPPARRRPRRHVVPPQRQDLRQIDAGRQAGRPGAGRLRRRTWLLAQTLRQRNAGVPQRRRAAVSGKGALKQPVGFARLERAW